MPRRASLVLVPILLALSAALPAVPGVGPRPQELALGEDGRLRPYPERLGEPWNWPFDPFYISSPLSTRSLGLDPGDAVEVLRRATEATAGFEVVTVDGDYLHAEHRSGPLGFADDFVLLFERQTGTFDMRWIPRRGEFDRRSACVRIESVRTHLAAEAARYRKARRAEEAN